MEVDSDLFGAAVSVGRSVVWFDREMGESLAGEALIEALEANDGRPMTRGFVFGIVRWRCTDYVRSELGRAGGRRPARLAGTFTPGGDRWNVDLEGGDEDWDSVLRSVDDGFGMVDAVATLESASRRLTSDERWIMAARADGWTLLAIAEAWGVTEGRICQLSSSARRKLERDLG